MAQYKIKTELAPYVGLAMLRVDMPSFTLSVDGGNVILTGDISKRKLRSIIRVAETRKKSDETGIKYVCRDDIGFPGCSGVIPEGEKAAFESAAL